MRKNKMNMNAVVVAVCWLFGSLSLCGAEPWGQAYGKGVLKGELSARSPYEGAVLDDEDLPDGTDEIRLAAGTIAVDHIKLSDRQLTISGNAAGTTLVPEPHAVRDLGGAIYAVGGSLVVRDVTFSGFYAEVAGGALALREMTGDSAISNCCFTSCRAALYAGLGGAVYASADLGLSVTLTVENSTFESCRAAKGGAITTGRVYPYDEKAIALDVSDCDFSGNLTSYAGGALWVEGDATFARTVFEANGSGAEGGAICVSSSDVAFAGSTIRCMEGVRFLQNVAHDDCGGSGNGGAIALLSAGVVLDVSRTEFTGNVGDIVGGAVYAYEGDTISVSTCVFANNTVASAEGFGGALCVECSTLSMTNSTIRNSNCGAVTVYETDAELVNCVVVGNAGGDVNGYQGDKTPSLVLRRSAYGSLTCEPGVAVTAKDCLPDCTTDVYAGSTLYLRETDTYNPVAAEGIVQSAKDYDNVAYGSKFCGYSMGAYECATLTCIAGESYTVLFDSKEHVNDFTSDCVTITPIWEYATSASGPWSSAKPAFTEVGVHTTWAKATYLIGGVKSFELTTSATVTITTREITLVSASAKKPYDGMPLTTNAVWVAGTGDHGLAPGDVLEFACNGSQTVVGTSDNTFTYTIRNAQGKDVTGDYTISKVYGELKVQKAKPPDEDGPDLPPEAGPFYDGPGEEPPTPGEGPFADSPLSDYDLVDVYAGIGYTIDTNALWATIATNEVYRRDVQRLSYSFDGRTWRTELPVFTNVTVTSMWYRIESSNYSNYIHAAGVTITNRHVAIESGSKTFSYTGRPQAYTNLTVETASAAEIASRSKLTGFVPGEGLATTTNWATVLNAGDEVDNTFDYTLRLNVRQYGSFAANYALHFTYGELAVTNATIEKAGPREDPTDERPPDHGDGPWVGARNIVKCYDGVGTNIWAEWGNLMPPDVVPTVVYSTNGTDWAAWKDLQFTNVCQAVEVFFRVSVPNYDVLTNSAFVTITNAVIEKAGPREDPTDERPPEHGDGPWAGAANIVKCYDGLGTNIWVLYGNLIPPDVEPVIRYSTNRIDWVAWEELQLTNVCDAVEVFFTFSVPNFDTLENSAFVTITNAVIEKAGPNEDPEDTELPEHGDGPWAGARNVVKVYDGVGTNIVAEYGNLIPEGVEPEILYSTNQTDWVAWEELQLTNVCDAVEVFFTVELPNFDVLTNSAYVTIRRAELAFRAFGAERLYDGVGTNITVEVEGVEGLAKWYALDPSVPRSDSDLPATEADGLVWGRQLPHFRNVATNGYADAELKQYAFDGTNGAYVVWYKVTSRNYEDIVGYATVTVLPRTVRFEFPKVTKTFDGDDSWEDGVETNLIHATHSEMVGDEEFDAVGQGHFRSKLVGDDAEYFVLTNMDVTPVRGTLDRNYVKEYEVDGQVLVVSRDERGVTTIDGKPYDEMTEDDYPGSPAEITAAPSKPDDVDPHYQPTVKPDPEGGDPVDPPPATLSLSDYDTTNVYDGVGHTLDTNALWNAIWDPSRYTIDEADWENVHVRYSLDGVVWQEEPILFTNVTVTSFWYSVEIPNYQTAVHAVGVTVLRRELAVRATNQTMTFDDFSSLNPGFGVPAAWSNVTVRTALNDLAPGQRLCYVDLWFKDDDWKDRYEGGATYAGVIVTNRLAKGSPFVISNAIEDVTSNYAVEFQPGDLTVFENVALFRVGLKWEYFSGSGTFLAQISLMNTNRTDSFKFNAGSMRFCFADRSDADFGAVRLWDPVNNAALASVETVDGVACRSFRLPDPGTGERGGWSKGMEKTYGPEDGKSYGAVQLALLSRETPTMAVDSREAPLDRFTGYLVWESKDKILTLPITASQELDRDGRPLAKVGKLTVARLAAAVEAPADGASEADDAADGLRFASDELTATVYRYVAVSNAIRILGAQGGKLSLKKVSGTLPKGLSFAYDAKSGACLLTGVPTATDADGVLSHEAVFQVTESRKDAVTKKTVKETCTIRLVLTVVDPAKAGGVSGGALNAVLAKTRSYAGLAVIELGSSSLVGTLALSLPVTGKASAKFTCAEGALSYSAKGWTDLAADGTLRVVLFCTKKQYATSSVEVTVAASGDVCAVVRGLSEDDLAVVFGKVWSKTDSATAYKGQHVAVLTRSQVLDDPAGVAPGGDCTMALKMTTASQCNVGKMAWAVKLANGKSLSGNAILSELPEASGVAYLPTFAVTKADLFGAVVALTAGATVQVSEPTLAFGGDEVPIKPCWSHAERIGKQTVSYALRYGLSGGVDESAGQK